MAEVDRSEELRREKNNSPQGLTKSHTELKRKFMEIHLPNLIHFVGIFSTSF